MKVQLQVIFLNFFEEMFAGIIESSVYEVILVFSFWLKNGLLF